MIQDELKSFIDFLLEKNIIQIGVSFLIASQVRKLSTNFVDSIIKPIGNNIYGEDLNKKTTKIGNITFKTGLLLNSFIELFIIMILLFYIYRISRPEGILDNITNKFSNFFT